MKYIDIIQFGLTSSNLDLNYISNFSHFHILKNSDKTGIIINEEDDLHKEYDFTCAITQFFIEYETKNNNLVLRNLDIDMHSRIYQGITEMLTQKTWSNVNFYEDCIGEKESRYLFETQLANVLMDIIGKSIFIEKIIKSPTDIFSLMASIPYKDDNLLNYVDKKLQCLNSYKGIYSMDKLDYESLLDSFEALCDCQKQLKFTKKEKSK